MIDAESKSGITGSRFVVDSFEVTADTQGAFTLTSISSGSHTLFVSSVVINPQGSP